MVTCGAADADDKNRIGRLTAEIRWTRNDVEKNKMETSVRDASRVTLKRVGDLMYVIHIRDTPETGLEYWSQLMVAGTTVVFHVSERLLLSFSVWEQNWRSRHATRSCSSTDWSNVNRKHVL